MEPKLVEGRAARVHWSQTVVLTLVDGEGMLATVQQLLAMQHRKEISIEGMWINILQRYCVTHVWESSPETDRKVYLKFPSARDPGAFARLVGPGLERMELLENHPFSVLVTPYFDTLEMASGELIEFCLGDGLLEYARSNGFDITARCDVDEPGLPTITFKITRIGKTDPVRTMVIDAWSGRISTDDVHIASDTEIRTVQAFLNSAISDLARVPLSV